MHDTAFAVQRKACRSVSPRKCELNVQEEVGGGLEGAAAHTCMATLKALQAQAQRAGLDRPAGDGTPSWDALCDAVETACEMATQALAEPGASGGSGSPSAAGLTCSAANCAGHTQISCMPAFIDMRHCNLTEAIICLADRLGHCQAAMLRSAMCCRRVRW